MMDENTHKTLLDVLSRLRHIENLINDVDGELMVLAFAKIEIEALKKEVLNCLTA
jgi:hypothetical protein